MKIPGMHYQDFSWKIISTSLADAMARSLLDLGLEKLRPEAQFLQNWPAVWIASEARLREKAPKLLREHNVHGVDCLSLALDLLEALSADLAITDGKRVRSSALQRLANSMPKDDAVSKAKLRDKCQNVLSEMRDRIDIPRYLAALDDDEQALPPATGNKPRKKKAMSSYRLHQLRVIDTCLHGIAGFFNNWQQHPQKLAQVLGHEVFPTCTPFEVIRFQRQGYCEAAWLLRWSEHFAPKDEDGEGPLHPNKLTAKKWALKSLEAQINETIVDLVEEAKFCERFAPHLNMDFVLRMQSEAQDAPFSRLQTAPSIDHDANADFAATDVASSEEDSTGPYQTDYIEDGEENDSPGTESLYVGAADSWDEAEATPATEPEPEPIFLACLQGHQLALQVGILFELYPYGEHSMLRLLTRMKTFETWHIPATLDALSGELLASKHVLPVPLPQFWEKVKTAKQQFLTCCTKKMENAH